MASSDPLCPDGTGDLQTTDTNNKKEGKEQKEAAPAGLEPATPGLKGDNAVLSDREAQLVV